MAGGWRRAVRLLLCSSAALFMIPSLASAATFTWTGQALGLNKTTGWTRPADWGGGTAPAGSVGEIDFPTLSNCSDGGVLVCYGVVDDGGSVSASQISIEDGSYSIVPADATDVLAIGAGGLDVSESGHSNESATIGVPLSLTAPQTWLLGPGGLDLTGGLSGPASDPLTVDLAAGTLDLAGTNEVGPVSMSGGAGSGFAVLDAGDLNGVAGEPVAVNGTTLFTEGIDSTGPLTVTDSAVDIGSGVEEAEVDVNGSVTLDSQSTLAFSILQPGLTAGTDYSQLVAGGNIDLDRASLDLVNGPNQDCSAAAEGQSLTLLSTTGGTLSGQFAGIANGSKVAFQYDCGGGELPIALTINYTATSVTATVNLAPAVTVAPALSGAATQGQPESVTTGTWSNGPVSYAYQWQTCNVSDVCTPVPGATQASYTPSADDVGETLRVLVSASTAWGLQASTDAVGLSPVAPESPPDTAPPTISGSTVQGQTLAETQHADWVFPPDGYQYEWLRCFASGAGCQPIPSAMGPTYTFTADDVGYAIELEEVAIKGAISASATSAPTAVVMPLTPAETAPPTISGTPSVGDTLTEFQAAWVFSPVSSTYQWFDCDATGANCIPIPSATGRTYTLTPADYGSTIEVQDQVTRGAVTESATSAPTAVVTSLVPVDLDPPAISGQAVVGQTLTASAGDWSGGPTSYLYVWLACDATLDTCYVINGADGSTYTVADYDVGYVIVVADFGVNADGPALLPALSDPTAIVTLAPSSPTAPVVPPANPPPTTTTTATTTTATTATPTGTSAPSSPSTPLAPVAASAKLVEEALSRGLDALERAVKAPATVKVPAAHPRTLTFSFSAPGAGALKVELSLKLGHRTQLLATRVVTFAQAGAAAKSLELSARDERLISSRRRPVFVLSGDFVPVVGAAASLTKTFEGS